MNFGSKSMSRPNSFVAPIAFISLFTLSTAVMGYLFGYLPATLYFDGKKKQAVNMFLQTVAVFAGLTVVTFAILFSGVIS
ncbi:hypothetical protein L6255_04080 [Candidatus Parcubacteria bacterium]|nr:hypothetical protein [Patescibacteria group bacterium]MCG2689588.1 hypothetical protein [Candidatus Parcubacteria bacterium]